MGLAERRKIKELQEVTFPGRVQEIAEICGVAIPLTSIGRAWQTMRRRSTSSIISPAIA